MQTKCKSVYYQDGASNLVIQKSCARDDDIDCLRPNPWDGQSRAYCCDVNDDGAVCNDDAGGYGINPPSCGESVTRARTHYVMRSRFFDVIIRLCDLADVIAGCAVCCRP